MKKQDKKNQNHQYIGIQGARQNNLKGINLRIPLNKLTVVTGVSGSGKSSLAFDTVYSEGQRRYVGTFSTYTRQFLDRMDKPKVDRIEGIPPAIAIDQTNPVRTSRSTVGTMTELNDHLKLLFARASRLHCKGCGKQVKRDSPQSILKELLAEAGSKGKPSEKPQSQTMPLHEGQNMLITFPITVPEGYPEEEVLEALALQGYRRIHEKTGSVRQVIQDRVALNGKNRARIVEDLEAALKFGKGNVSVFPLDEGNASLASYRFSADLHCPECDIHYRDPTPNHFSFNSPIGACDVCRGFGRTIGVDYDLVIPDNTKTLAEGAVKPWQTESYRECHEDMIRFARRRGVPVDVPWREMSLRHKSWVLEGEGSWVDGKWYGVKRFFEWLETKSYKMHIRVLLSKYRAYRMCPSCGGARLKPEGLLWRIGKGKGFSIHDVMLLPIDRCREFFQYLKLPDPLDEATELLLREIRSRLGYLVEVGLGYLTLDRQSRTLSGGEVQRINLTTALGTSLVNTLFVLDEPSIGLHPRDIKRLIHVLHRLRDAGNTLIVVEHDSDVIRAADYIIDMGPGAGERGGEVVFFGALEDLIHSGRSLTAQYLTGRKRVSGGEQAVTDHNPRAGPEYFSVKSHASHKNERTVSKYTASGPFGSSSSVAETVAFPQKIDSGSQYLQILGASEHNLKNIDVLIPLGKLVCITGVSGSGKSTLVQDILYNALCKIKHRPVETAGRHTGITGHENIAGVVLVDQSPIGKTTRSNPASYVGAFDTIRRLFSTEPLARERGYTPGTFSFNSGRGRCPTCGGNGFQHIEMQFLSDVYLRCPDCDGRRYRTEVLDVRLLKAGQAKSIADVLSMTVSEACGFYADTPEVLRALEPLRAVGLDYVTLGQPVPTLSGGEAQRLKLAGHLARSRTGRSVVDHLLFLFDEPTTGLHFDDIATLLAAFRQMLGAGHSVVVIEHNLDVIRSSDWIIDLGPEGGEGGGEVVCEGTVFEVIRCGDSHTGRELKRIFSEYPTTGGEGRPKVEIMGFEGFYKGSGLRHSSSEGFSTGEKDRWKMREAAEAYMPETDHSIFIRRAREHNLKNIDIRIPRNTFTVITGVSGSGKSTVAFDILFSEGQRRYLESLNAYARQFVQPASRPDVDGVYGVPPTVAIEQRVSRGGRKSTVATVTEIYHFLRLLYVKLGIQHCPDCKIPIQQQSSGAILARILREYRGEQVLLLAPLVVNRKGYYTDLARWAAGKGYAHLRVDGILIPTKNWPRLDRFREHSIELPVGEVKVSPGMETELRKKIELTLEIGKGVVYAAERKESLNSYSPVWSETIFSTKRVCPGCGRSFEDLDPRFFSFNSKHGWCPLCYGTGLELPGFDEEQTGEEIWWNEWWEGTAKVCPQCNGHRLRDEALGVRFRGKNIADITHLSVEEAERYFRQLQFHEHEKEIARDIISELLGRLSFLKQVGLPYLTLERAAPTLSSGEAQRIRLASQLGSNLRGVCYILDEPTIGLHARDNRKLLKTLDRLKARGNTVVVVEHDEETIRRAEHIVDLGPGGGVNGGRLVAEGTVEDLLKKRDSLTAQFLREPLRHPLAGKNRRPFKKQQVEQNGTIKIIDANLHNLNNLDVTIPGGRLVCITGVSGSGKSTLVRDILYENLRHLITSGKKNRRGNRGSASKLHGCLKIEGWDSVKRVLEVNQTPIGKTPRSCPATYVGFWNDIRRLFAATVEARVRGYAASRFSFNVTGRRCQECAGQGMKKIEMSFLPNVSVVCDVCGGKRFNPETLSIRYKDKTIADVLAMSVDEAVDFFAPHRKIHHALCLLQEVGLGYLTLGQQSPTLSGGEAQRIKLVTELAKTRPEWSEKPVRGKGGRKDQQELNGHSLYVLDEPTIGLHIADVEKLVRVLNRLVDAGNTVVIIEHNLDVIAEADWVIDLGPEGGDGGGEIVAEGPPEQVAKVRKGSHTARYLARFLKERGPSFKVSKV
jgi:excinuclease ABC subunit A